MRYSTTIAPDSAGRIKATVTFNGEKVRVNVGVTVKPNEWNAKKNEVRASATINGRAGSDINYELMQIRNAIDEAMRANPNKESVKTAILQCIGKEVKMDTTDLLEMYDRYIEERDVSEGRKKHYKVTRKKIANYLEIKRKSSKFVSIQGADVEKFYKDEVKKYSINWANEQIKNLKAFWHWSEMKLKAEGKELHNPFEAFKASATIFGTPQWLNREELDVLIGAELTGYKDKVRDMFVFQCHVGCRVGDLVSLKKSNIYKGVLSYVPVKTSHMRAEVIKVPLSSVAEAIIKKYKDTESEMLMPFISDQKYNKYLKELFKQLNLDRPITLLDPRTRTPKIVPLYDAISSHYARRTFVGRLYEADVKDSVIASMSGHAEGSKAFNRYRAVTEELKNNAIKALE
jgi:integrase